jgi:hypothetical protein
MGKFIRENLPDPLSYYQGRGLVLLPGKEWRFTSCDFHGGRKTMRINVKSGAFKCMAECGAKGGDVIAYEMAIKGCSFVEAAKLLNAYKADGAAYVGPTRPRKIPAGDLISLVRFEMYVSIPFISKIKKILIENAELRDLLLSEINEDDFFRFFKSVSTLVYIWESEID